jgi:hypothetical protein
MTSNPVSISHEDILVLFYKSYSCSGHWISNSPPPTPPHGEESNEPMPTLCRKSLIACWSMAWLYGFGTFVAGDKPGCTRLNHGHSRSTDRTSSSVHDSSSKLNNLWKRTISKLILSIIQILLVLLHRCNEKECNDTRKSKRQHIIYIILLGWSIDADECGIKLIG